MWLSNLEEQDSNLRNVMLKGNNYSATTISKPIFESSYDEEEGEEDTIVTGPTLSTIMDPDLSLTDTFHTLDMPSSVLAKRFEADILNQTRTITSSSSSPSRNTYFLDGGHRFISLPTLGTHTKTAAHISRVFEEWLQNKLYHQHMADDRLPILEDSVDLLAEDIMNKLKSRQSVRGLIGGVAKIMIKIRTGHMYCFHQQTDNGLPSIEANVMDFIQQFPLFLDTVIYVVPTYTEHVQDDCIPILITIENVSTNPSDPYYLFENVSLLG